MDGLEDPFDVPLVPQARPGSSYHAFARREARLTVAFLVLAATLLAMVGLGFQIWVEGTSASDCWLLLAMRSPANLAVPEGCGWLQVVAIDVSALGGVTALSLFTVTAIGYLLSARRLDHGRPACGSHDQR